MYEMMLCTFKNITIGHINMLISDLESVTNMYKSEINFIL